MTRTAATAESRTIRFDIKPAVFPILKVGDEVWLPLAGTRTRRGYFADYRRADGSAIAAMGSLPCDVDRTILVSE